MAARRKTDTAATNLPSTEEVLGALTTIVPTMKEGVTVDLAARALASRFNVRVDDIKATYRGFLFRCLPKFIHPPSAEDSISDCSTSALGMSAGRDSSDESMIQSARRRCPAASTTSVPTTTASGASVFARKGESDQEDGGDDDEVAWVIEVAPDVLDARMRSGTIQTEANAQTRTVKEKKAEAAKMQTTKKTPVARKRPVKAVVTTSFAASQQSVTKKPRLKTAGARAWAPKPSAPREGELAANREIWHDARSKPCSHEARGEVPEADQGQLCTNQRGKKGPAKKPRSVENLIGLAKAVGELGPNSALSRTVKAAESDAAKFSILRTALNALGHHWKRSYPTKREIAAAKAVFESRQEMDGISSANILNDSARRRRSVLNHAGADADSSDSNTRRPYDHAGSDDEEKEDGSDEFELSDGSLE